MIEDRVEKIQEAMVLSDVSSKNTTEETRLANLALASVGLRAEQFHFHPSYIDAVNLRSLSQEERT
jgi:hypothetical protein